MPQLWLERLGRRVRAACAAAAFTSARRLRKLAVQEGSELDSARTLQDAITAEVAWPALIATGCET